MTPRPARPWSHRVSRTELSARRLRVVVEHLRGALRDGDRARLETALRRRVTLVVDSGGRIPAPPVPVRGRSEVAAILLQMLGGALGGSSTVASVNGSPALVYRRGDTAVAVVVAHMHGPRISDVWVVANPDKLHHWNGQ